MADHSGVIGPEVITFERGKNFSFPPDDPSPDFSTILANLDVGLGPTGRPGRTENTKKDISGVTSGGDVEDVIFERVYVTPLEIDLDLIVEDTVHQISIWNSSFQNAVDITQILQANATGTLLTDNGIPETIPHNYDTIHTVQVFRVGPPVQNTEYIYTVDGQSFTLNILGNRVEPFPFLPNWGDAYNFTYAYKTVQSSSPKFAEQRRAMYETPRRRIEAGFWENERQMEKLYNFLHGAKDVIIAIPVFRERLTVTNPTIEGEAIMQISEDFAKFTNLVNFTSFVMLQDALDPEVNEIKQIANSGIDTINKTITVTNTVGDVFTPDQVDLYPVMFGFTTADSFKASYVTDNLLKIGLKLQEQRL